MVTPDAQARSYVVHRRKNPEVYALLVRLSREYLVAGGQRSRRLSIRMLVERARWEAAVSDPPRKLAVNNNYVPFYAREIMEREPDLAGVFELRQPTKPRSGLPAGVPSSPRALPE